LSIPAPNAFAIGEGWGAARMVEGEAIALRQTVQSNTLTLKRARTLRKAMSCRRFFSGTACAAASLGNPSFVDSALGPYVLDFYRAKAKLCIEVDGRGHELRIEQDARRDRWLEVQGIEVVRYPASAVLSCPEAVVEERFLLAARRFANPELSAVR
jgi:very-short-patch-repair endonuclease